MIILNLIILLNICILVNSNFLIKTSDDDTTIDWWENAAIYQIYPRSFKDSDGDGIGDLNGITSKLPHLNDIGVNTIWLSPIFKSPQIDFGYDVEDFREIHYEYGTMKDFEDLVTACNLLEIRILLDFVPNHSSNKHDWFKKSEESQAEYDNYYIWANASKIVDGVPIPPNNWISVFGGSAWSWSNERSLFYLHQFKKEQPDLNYRNPKVELEMRDILRFWLDKGVDGFRFDAINHLFEAEDLPDEPPSGNGNPGEYDYLEHIYTKDQSLVYDTIYGWRELLDNWKTNNNGDTKIFMTEAYANISFTMKYYESDTDSKKQGAHLPFNFWLIYDIKKDVKAENVNSAINTWLENMPKNHVADWVLGSHDHSRVASRIGEDKVNMLNALLLTLPGVSVTYYGEEIGMTDNTDFTPDDSRDPNRTPMQWDNTTSAGFSKNKNTWLPVNKNYDTLNVAAQLDVPFSHLEFYKSVANLRKEKSMISGEYTAKVFSEYIFGYKRELKNNNIYLVIFNFGKSSTIDLSPLYESEKGTVKVEIITGKSTYKARDELDYKSITIEESDVIILSASAVYYYGSILLIILNFVIVTLI